MKISMEYIIETIDNKGFVFIDFIKYCGSKSIVKVICDKGHEPYEVSFSTITRKNRASSGCPVCKKINKRATNINKVKYDDIKKYIESFNYTLITNKNDYNGIYENIVLKCPNGHILKTTYAIFKKRTPNNKFFINKCEYCFKEDKLNKAIEKCKDKNYTLLTKEYTSRNMKLDIICDKGHEWHPTYENLMRNDAKCLTCNNKNLGENQKLSFNKVKSIIEKSGYKLISDKYVNYQDPLDIMCPEGHIYSTSLSNFVSGRRCHECSMSSGEQEISQILTDYKINFETQYKFKDCCNIKPLPFDFYLNDYNCCIEFDGIQHFKIIKHFGGYDNFVKRKINDTIKTLYCNNNNIKLIRIPYTDIKNIENILIEKLNLI